MKKKTKKTELIKMSKEEKQQTVSYIRELVRTREDFQKMRINMGNRLGLKADGKPQDLYRNSLEVFDYLFLKQRYKDANNQEKFIQKELKKVLKNFPIYTEWLQNVKGVGDITAAWIIGWIDIEEATTVSKIWQYSGFNPGMVRGKKRIKGIGKEQDKIGITEDFIRGDKLTSGYVSPFNKDLRKIFIGILASGFIKSKAPYSKFYYDYKTRKENDTNEVWHCKKGGKPKLTKWCDVSKGHRDSAAKRYMVKMFLKDLYAEWRKIEGLPVREPYAVEYLGKKHEENVLGIKIIK